MTGEQKYRDQKLVEKIRAARERTTQVLADCLAQCNGNVERAKQLYMKRIEADESLTDAAILNSMVADLDEIRREEAAAAARAKKRPRR